MVTGRGRMVANALNTNLILNSENPELEKWRHEFLGRSFFPLFASIKYTEDHEANLIGPVYTKPVAILANRNCMNVCEVFVANMVDNHIARFYGEDSKTGATGFVTADYNAFLNVERPLIFPALPFANEMPESAKPNIIVPWQAFLRNDGSLINENGIHCMVQARPFLEDVLYPEKSSSLYRRIVHRLVPQEEQSTLAQSIMKEPVNQAATVAQIVAGPTFTPN